MLTENLNFFYRLNNELKRLKLKFSILNFDNKIPSYSSILLTTKKEYEEIKKKASSNVFILPCAKDDNFDMYMLKVLASYRIGPPEYSELLFSIDPGTKYFGLAVFLDDYYLNSHTFYSKEEFLKSIKNYVEFLQDGNPEILKLIFKFGRGVLSICLELVSNTLQLFKDRMGMEFLLIDEYKSSKIKIHHKDRDISKHEYSALILALRDGIEVINQETYTISSNDFKIKKLPRDELKSNSLENIEGFALKLEDMVKKLLKGEISLSKSYEVINNYEF